MQFHVHINSEISDIILVGITLLMNAYKDN